MQPRFRHILVQSVGLLTAAGLQIWSVYWRLLFRQRIAVGQFDLATFWLATVEILLGLASGFLIALILLPKPTRVASTKTPGMVIALSILLPTVALAIKWSLAANGFYLPLNFWLISDWAIYSGLPELWLGITSVVLIYHLRK